jgi:quercetin dioxygenase-like cupin family protein
MIQNTIPPHKRHRNETVERTSHSAPHRHGGAEEFYVIEGELRDHDGTLYKAGDVVWLAPGTVHNSFSENGCTVAVFSEKAEVPQNDSIVNRPMDL